MTTRTRWSILAVVAIALVTAGLLLPAVKRTNCGGNSAALVACKGYIMCLKLWSEDHEGSSFHFSQVDFETKRDLAHLPGANWIRSARLLARLEDVRLNPGGDKRIIIVCAQAYDNVPQRLFGRAPMTHAVAYSTGEAGLITPEEFGRLDLRGFVDLQTLSETSLVEPDGPTNGSSQSSR